MQKILLLGGTTEARELARILSTRDDLDATISLAGLTSQVSEFGLKKRIGGFGGIDGLCDYIRTEQVDMLIDATHPYAEQMSHHAAMAAKRAGIKRLALERPPWIAQEGDDWHHFKNWDDLIRAIPKGARVFLTAGQDGIKALNRPRDFEVMARVMEQPHPIPDNIEWIKSPPLATMHAEAELMQQHSITHLVSKNSGGQMAKLEAARTLSIPVFLLARPPMPQGETYPDIESLLAHL